MPYPASATSWSFARNLKILTLRVNDVLITTALPHCVIDKQECQLQLPYVREVVPFDHQGKNLNNASLIYRWPHYVRDLDPVVVVYVS